MTGGHQNPVPSASAFAPHLRKTGAHSYAARFSKQLRVRFRRDSLADPIRSRLDRFEAAPRIVTLLLEAFWRIDNLAHRDL